MSKKTINTERKTQSFDNSRRRFIKGAAYTSALSVGGLSSLAFAAKVPADKSAVAIAGGINSVEGAITVIQETQFDREKVTLINQSGTLQMLDARQPISLHQVNGILIVTVNQNTVDAVNGMMLMSPNESVTFDVKAIGIDVSNTTDLPALTNLAENQLQINSEHSVFNRIVPVQLA